MLGNKTGLLRQVLIAFDKNRKGTAMVRKINLLLLKTVHGRVLDGFRLWKTIPEDRSGKMG